MKQSQSFIQSVTHSSHTRELAEQLGEVAIDQFLSNEILKEIPLIGTAISLFNAGNGIAAYFFAKKIITFLNEIEKIPQSEREEFIQKNSTKESMEEIGEATLMILEKSDSIEVAKMLGRAFALLINSKIVRPDFDLYVHIIKNLNPYLIRQLSCFYEHKYSSSIEPPAASLLSNYGLITSVIAPTLNAEQTELTLSFKRNNFGLYFYEEIIRTQPN